MNYPVGVALSNEGHSLFVVNSDFDLRFNTGTVQVLDTEVILEHLPRACLVDADCSGGRRCAGDGAEADASTFGLCVDSAGSPCGDLPLATAADEFSYPGPCTALPLGVAGLQQASAVINPFVADVKYVPGNGRRGARILMPVRGDATLHWAAVHDDVLGSGPVLDCGQTKGNARCDSDHRLGDEDRERTADDDKLPTEPFGIAVSSDGEAIFVGHQSQGSVSVFDNAQSAPRLRSVLTGLPSNPMGLLAVPPPRAAVIGAVDYTPGVLVSYRFGGSSAPNVELLRYYDSEAAAPASPYLERAATSPITTNASGSDSRGIDLDASRRDSCERDCDESACSDEQADACRQCQLECAAIGVDVYMANRSPDSLLRGETRPAFGDLARDDVPNFSDAVPLRGSPSRVIVGSITDERGNPAMRVFVLGFDAQLMYIYDPQRREVEAHVKTGPGPQALVVDESRSLGYLAHFTHSYLGVIDLDKRHATYGQVLLSVGSPRPPRTSN